MDANFSADVRIFEFELVAGRRRIFEFCCGSRSFRDSREPGRGWSVGGIFAGKTAFCGNLLGDLVCIGTTSADAGFRVGDDASSAVRCADGAAYGGFAIYGQPSHGGAEEGDGFRARYARERSTPGGVQ